MFPVSFHLPYIWPNSTKNFTDIDSSHDHSKTDVSSERSAIDDIVKHSTKRNDGQLSVYTPDQVVQSTNTSGAMTYSLEDIGTKDMCITDVQAADVEKGLFVSSRHRTPAKPKLSIRAWARENSLTLRTLTKRRADYFFAVKAPSSDTLIWVSSRTINSYYYKPIIESTLRNKPIGKVLVLYGTHGDRTGGTIQNRKRLDASDINGDTLTMIKSFSEEDQTRIDVKNIAAPENNEKWMQDIISSGD